MLSFLLCAIIASAEIVFSYIVVLSGDNDIVHWETAQFKAEVFLDNGEPANNDTEFKFSWSDNAKPQHTAELVSKSPASWNVTYNSSFPTQSYSVIVKCYKFTYFVWVTIGSANKSFELTEFLKGDMLLSQGNLTRNKYISNAESVTHQIELRKSHIDFLNKTKNFLRTFWFVDCVYYGQQNGFQFNFNYTKLDTVHYVESLLVAAYIPALSKVDALSINSTKAASSNSTLPDTNGTISSFLPNGNNLSVVNETVNVDNIDPALKQWLDYYNQTQNSIISKSNYCINSSSIPIISNYTFGFFRKHFTVKAPVKVSPINGTNWLMDGEVLNINVTCNGSSPYSFCVLLKAGLYNVTGNETCKEETYLKNCSFGIQHLFKKPSEYTLIVIISNSVSHVVKPIAVNIYKVKKHAQLSVIIVPVSFSLIATILIIFGVAYYVQSKRKYTIEVADFDFGNQTSNMEYKTFTDRLRESISNSLLKSNDYEEADDSWPESASNSRKYGSIK